MADTRVRTVGELRAALKNKPDKTPILMQSDEEGNGIYDILVCESADDGSVALLPDESHNYADD